MLNKFIYQRIIRRKHLDNCIPFSWGVPHLRLANVIKSSLDGCPLLLYISECSLLGIRPSLQSKVLILYVNGNIH